MSRADKIANEYIAKFDRRMKIAEARTMIILSVLWIVVFTFVDFILTIRHIIMFTILGALIVFNILTLMNMERSLPK